MRLQRDCRIGGQWTGWVEISQARGYGGASNSDPLNKASKPSIILTTDRPTKSHAGSIPPPLVVHSRIGIVRDMVNLDSKRDLTVLKSRSLRTGRARSRVTAAMCGTFPWRYIMVELMVRYRKTVNGMRPGD